VFEGAGEGHAVQMTWGQEDVEASIPNLGQSSPGW
jgi:hypothetical protein